MQKMGSGSGSGVGEKKAPNGETPRAPVGTASMPTATRIHLSATGSGVPTVHCTEVSSLTGGAMSQGLVVPGLSGESSGALLPSNSPIRARMSRRPVWQDF